LQEDGSNGTKNTHAQRDDQNQPFRLPLLSRTGDFKTGDEADAPHKQPEQPAAKKQHGQAGENIKPLYGFRLAQNHQSATVPEQNLF
jgi:hypothetical protein